MARHVYNTLDEFDLKHKLFCITTDSASNNYKMVKELATLLLEKDNINWNSETCHIPCLAHTINIVFKSFSPTLPLGKTMKWTMTLTTILTMAMKTKSIEFRRVPLQMNLHPYHPFGPSSTRSVLSPSQFVVVHKSGNGFKKCATCTR